MYQQRFNQIFKNPFILTETVTGKLFGNVQSPGPNATIPVVRNKTI